MTLGQHRFIHVHASSDSHPSDKMSHARIFREAAPPLFIAESRNLPLVVGDFHCVQDALDTTANFRSKVCRPLADLLSTFPLLDCFRHFHPSAREYTFRRPGVAPSRLDRAYVLGPLLSSVSAMRQLSSTSDHAALLVSFGTPLGVQMASPPPRSESYWKLNASILEEPDFGPLFEAEWQGVLGDRSLASFASAWWEEVVKPFFRYFCQRFSKMAAHRRRETRNFFQVALAAALETEDWPRVRGCRARMEELDRALLRGQKDSGKGSSCPWWLGGSTLLGCG